MMSLSNSIINACSQSDLLAVQLQETLNKKMKTLELSSDMTRTSTDSWTEPFSNARRDGGSKSMRYVVSFAANIFSLMGVMLAIPML